MRIAATNRKTLWTRRPARQLLDERLGRNGNNAAFGQNREGVGALADEMRRWVKTRAPVDTAVRQKGDGSSWRKGGNCIG